MNKKVNAFIRAMEKKELRLSIAESITCGMISEMLGNTIGTSKIFEGSIVCYTPEVKKKLFGISQRTIDKHTTESMEVTALLSKNLKKLIKADIHAAVTGLASEGGSESKAKPVGTVFFCFLYKGRLYKEKKLFRGTPMEIREKASISLLDFIRSKI